MSSDPDAQVYCRHLLVCRTVWYDEEDPVDSYSLGRVVVNVHPPSGVTGPFRVPRLFVFAQLFGDAGDYTARVRLVRVEATEDGDEAEHPLGEWGPFIYPVTGIDLVDPRAFALPNVPFDGPGVFEFQLWLDELDEPIGRERVQVPEVIPEGP